MKTLICLLATTCVCNATFLSLFGGKGGQSPRYYHGNNHFDYSPEVIKVFLDQGHIGSQASTGSYSYASGPSYRGYGHGGEAQVFKVISQNAAAPIPTHLNHGYSADASGTSYATTGFNSFNAQFDAILPQILQLVLEDRDVHDGGYIYGAGGDISSQLASHFGHSGRFFVRRINGKSNRYYSDGHVIQKGVLEIRRIEGSPASGPPPVFSSHVHPVHGW